MHLFFIMSRTANRDSVCCHKDWLAKPDVYYEENRLILYEALVDGVPQNKPGLSESRGAN